MAPKKAAKSGNAPEKDPKQLNPKEAAEKSAKKPGSKAEVLAESKKAQKEVSKKQTDESLKGLESNLVRKLKELKFTSKN